MLSQSEILFWMSLALVPVSRQSKAIKHAGSVSALWERFGKDAALDEIFGDKTEVLKRYHSEQFIADCLEKLVKMNVKVATIYNPYYGELLRQPEVAAPYVLYYKGNARLFSSDCFAVVGTRTSSIYGKNMTEKIAGTLAENGFTIVSGLATGIDTFAHAAALNVKGKTIAVLGSGLNKIGPVGNMALADKILSSGGAIMSEYLPNMTATRFTFPERNRLISGLSKGVCVIEAGDKSGALITAKFALDQNRDVFAVPGNVGNIRSAGTNRLLYEGALVARSGEDILAHYGMLRKPAEKKKLPPMDDDTKKVFDMFIDADSVCFDDIVESTELSPKKVSSILTRLEIDKLIMKINPNEFSKNGD